MPTNIRERKGNASKKKKESTKEMYTSNSKENVGQSESFYLKCLVCVATVGLSAAAILFKSGSDDGVVTFSAASNISQQLTYSVKCSDDYQQEGFNDCKPKLCGRVVRDNLITEEEASHLLQVAKRGLSYGGSSGGASILDLHSGALSKNDKFINIYSVLSEEDGFTERDFTIYRQVKNKIHQAIAEYFNIPIKSLYLTKPTFFSRMNTTEAKTVHDEYWHPHVDKITYGSFHYTSLLYLSTYGKDFTGGRFIFVDKDVNRTVEPRIGRVSFFTSGSENVHFVEKLMTGIRYAITISFTCNPDMSISDPTVR